MDNQSGKSTTRMPSTVKTYENIGYILTDNEKMVLVIVFFTGIGIIVVTGIYIFHFKSNHNIMNIIKLLLSRKYYLDLNQFLIFQQSSFVAFTKYIMCF